MDIVTLADALDDASQIRRLVEARNSMRRSLTDGLRAVLDENERCLDEFAAINPIDDLSAALDVVHAQMRATDGLIGLHEVLAQLRSVQLRVERSSDSGVAAMQTLLAVGSADVPEAMLPDDVRPLFAELRERDLDAEAVTRSMVNPARRVDFARVGKTLARLHHLRLRTLQALVLARLAGTLERPGEYTPDGVDDARTVIEEHATDLRGAARRAASRIDDARVGPDVAFLLWGALYRFETWLAAQGATSIAAAVAGAYHEGRADLAAAMSSLRKAGRLYEAFARALAFDAGIRALLIDYAVGNGDVLAELGGARDLPLGSATLDLARSSRASLQEAVEGDVVEIDGVVEAADYVVGGPAPRSVLTVGAGGASARITALVPFSAVESFGIVPGVWVQLRGTAFPTGKDDLEGPVLRVRRVRFKEAMGVSFSDRLVWLGRELFAYRPGGYDIVAGRPAGIPAAMAEIDLRQGGR